MQVMNLGISKHSSFTVKVHGTDEAQAIDEITDHLMSLNTMHAIVNKR
jgi:phosphocarrier protein HPr